MSKGEFVILLIVLGVVGELLSSLLGLQSLLFFTVIYGLVGYGTSKLLGSVNPAKAASDIGLMIVMAPIFLYLFYAALNPGKALEVFPIVVTLWVTNLPGMLIGDLAGSIVAGLTGS